MNEVKMALDVPTITALYEQGIADDEWQAWYGRAYTSHSDGAISDTILSRGDHDEQITIV